MNSDPNTNSVENGRRSGRSIEAESAGNYASMEDIKKEVVKVLGKNYWPDKQLTEAELKTETGIIPQPHSYAYFFPAFIAYPLCIEQHAIHIEYNCICHNVSMPFRII